MDTMAQRPSPATSEMRRLAEVERLRLGHPYLGDEHLLLGVLAHGTNPAAAMLSEHGLDLTSAWAGIARIVSEAGLLAAATPLCCGSLASTWRRCAAIWSRRSGRSRCMRRPGRCAADRGGAAEPGPIRCAGHRI